MLIKIAITNNTTHPLKALGVYGSIEKTPAPAVPDIGGGQTETVAVRIKTNAVNPISQMHGLGVVYYLRKIPNLANATRLYRISIKRDPDVNLAACSNFDSLPVDVSLDTATPQLMETLQYVFATQGTRLNPPANSMSALTTKLAQTLHKTRVEKFTLVI